MKSKRYWEDRANLRMAMYQKNGDKVVNIVSKAYDGAIDSINNDIQKIFDNFILNNDLTPKDARQLLNSTISNDVLKDIRNKIHTIQDEEMKKYMMAQLNTNAYKARITRLEALKESIYINTKKVADVELRESTKLYTHNIKQAYYSNIYDIQKGINLGFDVAKMPIDRVEEILKNKWLDKHYSKRIWDNTDTVAEKIQEIVMQGIMTGKSYRRLASDIEDMTSYGKMAAARLIKTETTYVTNMAELEAYKECDIDKYVFLATLDLRTSPQCRKLDMKVISVKDGVPGKNLPPLHAWCRSTTIAYVSEEHLKNFKRRARNPITGKNEVINNMSYDEWYKKYATHNTDTTEKQRSNKKNKENSINEQIIKSREYKEKFYKITQDKELANIMHKKAKQILKHRQNTNFEDLYLFSKDSKKVVANQTHSIKEFEVNYNKEIINAIKKNKEKTLISMHNHPNSKLPSGSDLESLQRNKYSKGIIICHNGDVIIYNTGKKEISGKLYDLYVDKYKRPPYNLSERDAYIRTLNEFSEKYGIEYEVL